jgi:2-oxoglutarate dehydrogenase E2 component (dihydrolipoamide succinyltransferase)
MATEIVVPELGESVLEATVNQWFKGEGDRVEVGEPLVELETDKVNLEVGAQHAGVLARIDHQEGEDVEVGDVLGIIEEVEETVEGEAPPEAGREVPTEEGEEERAAERAAAQAEETPEPSREAPASDGREAPEKRAVEATPVAQRIAQEQGVDLSRVEGTGSGGRVVKLDVQEFLKTQAVAEEQAESQKAEPEQVKPSPPPEREIGREERVRMSRRRRTIASRLVEAQQNAAILTTFNDVDMSAVMDLRRRRNPDFLERYGVKLGITVFFVKAVVGALKAYPRLNAELDGDEMILKRYYDIGVAIGAQEGLVVPVVRQADKLTFIEVERQIRHYAQAAQDKTLTLEDLRGGTFSITNGGVFGSLLSTPILNPPQVGILGLHRIEDRPVSVGGELEIRPMMYLAVSYDHRIVDGREAVQFLVRVKEMIEDPEKMLLEG